MRIFDHGQVNEPGGGGRLRICLEIIREKDVLILHSGNGRRVKLVCEELLPPLKGWDTMEVTGRGDQVTAETAELGDECTEAERTYKPGPDPAGAISRGLEKYKREIPGNMGASNI